MRKEQRSSEQYQSNFNADQKQKTVQKSIHSDLKRQTAKRNQKKKQKGKFDLNTVESLIFKKLDQQFLQFLQKFNHRKKLQNAIETMEEYFKNQINLQDAAKLSHQIIEDLTSKNLEPQVPSAFISTFIKILIKNKRHIKNFLNQKKGDKLLNMIPIKHLVQVIELYDLKVEEKWIKSFLKQLETSGNIQQALKLIILTNSLHKFNKQLTSYVKRLINEKRFYCFKEIPNLTQICQEIPAFTKAKNELLWNQAFFYYLKRKGWQYLQEIYEFHPQIIATVIGASLVKQKNTQHYLQGFVSICERMPQVYQQLKPKPKQIIDEERLHLLQKNQQICQNHLRSDHFSPSSKDYLSLKNQVIWVNDQLTNYEFKKIKSQILNADRIAIDTKLRLTTTNIDNRIDNITLIQVSTENAIYLFDLLSSQHPEIRSIFKTYFQDPKKVVLGYLIKKGLKGLIELFHIRNQACYIIELKNEYFELHKKKERLEVMSKLIFGKQICQKYSKTNWDRRPLNQSQIHYAAMNVFIIIKIWDNFHKISEKQVLSLSQKRKEKYGNHQRSNESSASESENQEERKQSEVEFEVQDFDDE